MESIYHFNSADDMVGQATDGCISSRPATLAVLHCLVRLNALAAFACTLASSKCISMQASTHLSEGQVLVTHAPCLHGTPQNIKTRGRGGRADGKHILTGPVYICGAEPGDTVEIQILDMKPRKNPQGKAFSSNGGCLFIPLLWLAWVSCGATCAVMCWWIQTCFGTCRAPLTI